MTVFATRRVSFGLALASCLVAGGPCFAWGTSGHQVVNEAAADLMTSPAAGFFQKNKKSLSKLANTPDGLWKKPQTFQKEASTHFFHWDRYRDSPLAQNFDGYVLSQALNKLGQSYVKDNGSAVWRVSGLFSKLVTALKAKDWKRTIQLAGVLGHYVADVAQPMHVSSDYDGQSIGRSGVHKYFEVTLMEGADRNDLLAGAQQHGSELRPQLDQVQRNGDATRHARTLVVSEGMASFEELSGVLSHFERDSQDDQALKEYFGPRLGSGAATLAKLWDLAVEAAGCEDGFPQNQLNVEEPAFIPLADETTHE